MKERRNIKRREFIDKYFPYVKNMVFKYKRSLPVGVEVQDLVNSGVIGLLLAADRYEEEKAGRNFMSYANFRIKGEIIQALRTQGRFNKQTRERIKIYAITQWRLQQKLGRNPNNQEMLDETKFTEKQMATLNSIMAISDYDLGSENVSEDSVDLLDNVEDLINKITDKEIINIKLPEAINNLNKKEQHVIKSYFYDERLLKEIADDLDVTESRVSQIRSEAIEKLRYKLKDIKGSE